MSFGSGSCGLHGDAVCTVSSVRRIPDSSSRCHNCQQGDDSRVSSRFSKILLDLAQIDHRNKTVACGVIIAKPGSSSSAACLTKIICYNFPLLATARSSPGSRHVTTRQLPLNQIRDRDDQRKGWLFFSIVISLIFFVVILKLFLLFADCNYPDYDFVVVGGNTIATPRLQVIAQGVPKWRPLNPVECKTQRSTALQLSRTKLRRTLIETTTMTSALLSALEITARSRHPISTGCRLGELQLCQNPLLTLF